MRTALRTVMLFALVWLTGWPVALADTVTLTNHAQYDGAVLSADAASVTLLSDGTQWTFPRSQVASVTYDKATAAEERAKSKRRAAAAARAHYEAEAPQTAQQRDAAAAVLQSNSSDVTVYGTSWCGYCRRARALLRRRHVPFADKDIERDVAANQEMRRKCMMARVRYQGVPVIDAFGTLMAGFDEERLDYVLKQHGY